MTNVLTFPAGGRAALRHNQSFNFNQSELSEPSRSRAAYASYASILGSSDKDLRQSVAANLAKAQNKLRMTREQQASLQRHYEARSEMLAEAERRLSAVIAAVQSSSTEG